MPDHAFMFSMRLPGTGGFDAMLGDLASSVLQHLGFTPADVDQVGAELRAALPPATPRGRELHVQYEARGGEIEIIMSQNGQRLVRVSRRLPSRS